jgi:hypothetical protein
VFILLSFKFEGKRVGVTHRHVGQCVRKTSVENAVPLHVDISYTGKRGFDLPSEDDL